MAAIIPTHKDFRYGTDDADQFCRLHYLDPILASVEKLPVVVILHGGFWKKQWNISNAAHTTLAPAIVSTTKYLAVEVEYRRGGSSGGGYCGSQDDVAASVNYLAELAKTYPIDLNRVILLGHSAGGQLCLWAADHLKKTALLSDTPSVVVPRLAVAISPITDMIGSYERHLSDDGDAVEVYMKCKPDSEENIMKYHEASPLHRLPGEVPIVLVTGRGDQDVPMDMVVTFRDAVVAGGGAAELILCEDDDDHYVPMNSSSDVWAKIQHAIDSAVETMV